MYWDIIVYMALYFAVCSFTHVLLLLRVAAAPVAIESGRWKKKIYQRELTLQTEENMPCEINFAHILG